MDTIIGNFIPIQERAEYEGKTKTVETVSDQEANVVSCVICLDSISERCIAKPCQHSYHYMCILQWLEVRKSCPLCNARVNELLSPTEDGRVRKVDISPW